MHVADKNKTVVIGAGIVGVSTAIWLARAGQNVVLIDRGTPGMGASYGNACILANSAVVPVTVPGLVKKAPKYLMDPNFPLFLRWGYLPKLAPWLMKYLGYANTADTTRIIEQLTPIIGDSVDQHRALARDTIADKWIRDGEYNYAYADRAAFDADHFGWSMRTKMGFPPEVISGPAVQEKEPILSRDIQLLAVNKDHGFIFNPASYVADLVRVLETLGGEFRQAALRDFTFTNDRISAVITDQGVIDCTSLVIAAGAWSRDLLKKLNVSIPLEAERGYHIVYKSPSIRPNNPIMVAAGKFVATPMEQGLRCAGMVEFGGLSDKKSQNALALMRRKVATAFPDMHDAGQEEWLGFRPAPADSLPLIGEIRQTGIFTAFGHHHVGLTGGPKTGRIVADLIAKRPVNLDLKPYSPMRFTK